MSAPSLDTVAAAVEVVESRGAWWAKSKSGCIGMMQVCPKWSVYPRAWLYHPDLNRMEGRRLLTYWYGRAGDWRRALAAYRCGNNGLRGTCGQDYARAVLLRIYIAGRKT